MLSTATIYYTKLSSTSVPKDYILTSKRLYKNKDDLDHAEGLFLADLKREIDDLKEVKEIQVRLVQNYSPCNNCKQGEPSGCADDILRFKKHMSERDIHFSLTIAFAEIDEDKEKEDANRTGLINLLQSGIELKLLKGEDKRQNFLSDKTFKDLTDAKFKELFETAISYEREKKEMHDRLFLGKLHETAGEQTAKVYILMIHFKRCL